MNREKKNSLVLVEEAERIILENAKDFGTETVDFKDCLGRVLAEDIAADRDLPPFNRVTMDGIAIKFDAVKQGIFSFTIKGIQSAGDMPVETDSVNDCIEIMTGSPLPESADTIIPYEDTDIKDGIANIRTNAVVVEKQNIHFRGKDKRKNEVLVNMDQVITPTVITIMSAVGKTKVLVKKVPKIIIISTGNELVDINETPTASQIRRSNNYTLEAVLQQNGMPAAMLHLPDDEKIIREELRQLLNDYDIILLSGGVSMGKSDYVPSALQELQVEKLFHKIKQRPGKPFWFGIYNKATFVFAFPGNPVSTFLCFYRYFLPWINKCLGIEKKKSLAVLGHDVSFHVPLQYFLQVKLQVNEKGELFAMPVEGNGSGDFANLLLTDAFMELPLERNEFYKGELFPVWTFKPFA